MAYGGGSFTTQNKVLPGAYTNVVSKFASGTGLADRGTVAAGLELSWGKEGEIQILTREDFNKNSEILFGYASSAPELLPIREMLLHASKILLWRLGTGTKAANTYATAKYAGTRGNDLKIQIKANIDNGSEFDVITLLDNTKVDVQTVSAVSELVSNAFIDFKSTATLAEVTATPLSGGANATVTNADHQAFLNAVETYNFNILCCSSATSTAVNLYTAYTQRLRDELGKKFQLVAYRPTTNYEGVIGVWNRAKTIAEQSLVYWVAGIEAGTPINKSVTNAIYDGESEVEITETQTQLETAVNEGKFMFHNANGSVRVLLDINTLTAFTAEKSKIFSDNQTVRTVDGISTGIVDIFIGQYLGVCPNDESGRAGLWNDVIKILREMVNMRAIEDFEDEAVTVLQGDDKNTVALDINGITVINAMNKLYMRVVIK